MTAGLTNAVLTKITGPGVPDRSGDPGAGTVLWTGRAAGYLKRIHRTALGPGLQVAGSASSQQVRVKVDVFTILNTTGAPILEAAGADWEATTVTIEDCRTRTPVTRVFRVVAMENRAAGLIVDSVRLELEEA